MHDHAHHATLAFDAAGLLPIILAMFMTGLAGGFGHCATMCGPFVMAQVGGGIAARPAGGGTLVMQRVGGGLLLPYHLGRLTTYTMLGAFAGGLSGMVVQATGFRWVLVGFLALAAGLFLMHGLAGLARWVPALGRVHLGRLGWAHRAGQALARPLRPLFANPTGANGYLLGVTLGFLPCGFLYAALASAVGVGSAVGGFLTMAAFALGTMPSLVTVGVLGSVAGSRWATAMRALTPALMLFNAGVVGIMAWHLLAR